MVFRRTSLFFSLLLISASACFSAENGMVLRKDTLEKNSYSVCSDSVFSFRSKRGFFPSLVHNFGEQAMAPFKMSSKQAWMVAGGIAVTGALFFVDEDIDNFFKPMKNKNVWINKSSPHITEFGGNYSLVFIGAFGGYGLISKNQKAVRTSLLAAQAAITSGVWIRLGKVLSGRERPSASYTHLDHDFWWGPFKELDSSTKGRGAACFDAFPSGHTGTVFSIATVFAHQYADKAFVPVFAYSLATLVGVSRLTEHEHWASDIFAGACIGYLCGKQVVKHERELEASSSRTSARKFKPEYFFSLSGDQVMMNCFLNF